MKGYKTSRDYKRLKELLDNGYEVVCFTTYDFLQYHKEPHEPMIVTDICRGRLLKRKDPQNDLYTFGVRGHTFCDYYPNDPLMNPYSFDELCESENIEFVEPTE